MSVWRPRIYHEEAWDSMGTPPPMPAGRSDKYGQVYVERVGLTGFSDTSEPIALLRAQDRYALLAMNGYLAALRADDRVPPEQVASVERQVVAFSAWREANPEKVRTPGVPASDETQQRPEEDRT